jgi:adenylate cyclase
MKYFYGILICLILALPLAYQSTLTEIIKLKTFDAFVPDKEPSGYFTILNITDKDLEKYGYPLRREILAQINVALLQRGAIGLGLVMSFPIDSPFGKADDDALAESLSFAPSVIATFENNSNDYPRTTGTVIMGKGASGIPAYGVRQNIEAIRKAASEGIAVSRPEVDSLIRRLPLLLKTPDGWVSSYGVESLKTVVNADSYIIKTNEAGIEEIVVQGIPPVKTDYLGRKWISWVDTPQTTIEEMDVEGRFVFIGYSAKGVSPQLSTSVGYKYPHEIQAALAESILIQDSPYVPDYALAVELSLFISTVAFVYVLLTVLGVTWGLVSFAGIFALTAYYGFYTIQQGLLIDVTWTLISQFITGSTAFYLRFREQWKKRKQIQKIFSSYLHPRQVKKLIKEDIKLDGERVYSSHLFVDIENYTTLSEQMEATKVTAMLNRILSMLIDQVHDTNGLHDNTIGDCIYASWNSVVALDKHENAALKCAMKMHEKMEELNEELLADGYPQLGIRCGINTDWVSQGSIGKLGGKGEMSSVRFTSIGDGVNTAARLESACKELGVNTVIGYNTAIKSDFKLRLLEPIKVKGKEKPLQVYTWV